jgi:hypothetical protein
MPKQNESEWNIKKRTDAEISSAIGYLDPDASDESNNSVVVTCVSVVLGFAFLISSIAFIILYLRVS